MPALFFWSVIMFEIKKTFIPEGTPARPGYPMGAMGVTIHNTGSTIWRKVSRKIIVI